MKKFSLLIVASLAVVSLAFAQGAGPKAGAQKGQAPKGEKGQQGGRMGGMRMMGNPQAFEELSKKLKLTDSQKKQMQAAAKEMMDKFQEMRPKETSGQPQRPSEDQMKKMREISQTYQQKIEKILTPTQQKQLKEYQKEMREKMMKERGGRPGGAPATGGKPTKGKGGA